MQAALERVQRTSQDSLAALKAEVEHATAAAATVQEQLTQAETRAAELQQRVAELNAELAAQRKQAAAELDTLRMEVNRCHACFMHVLLSTWARMLKCWVCSCGWQRYGRADSICSQHCP